MIAIPDTIKFCGRESFIRLSDGRLFVHGQDATRWDGKKIEKNTAGYMHQVKLGSTLGIDGVTKIEKFTVQTSRRDYFVRRLAVPENMRILRFGAPGSVWFDVVGFRERWQLMSYLDCED